MQKRKSCGDSAGDGSVAAVIINYNGGDALLKCIDSTRNQSHPSVQTVVVDNLSSDDSLQNARRQFPDVMFVENSHNAGWGVGCNAGIEATKSEFVALINNDAYLDRECIQHMVEGLRSGPDYGSCASRILLADDPTTIEAAGVAIFRDGSSFGRGRLRPAREYEVEEEIFCANDCCCLYRRSMIDEVGLYDPDFFIYCDETDVGWRHQLAGWKCIYAPKALAYHAHSRSAGSYTDFKAYHVERNRIFLCLKYFPVRDLALSVLFAACRYLLQVRLSVSGKGALAEYRRDNSLQHGFGVLVRAHWGALKKAPLMLRRRREFMSGRTLTGREVSGLFRRYGTSTTAAAGYI